MTTRQSVQVHGLGLDDVVPAMVELAREGLSSKGSGGNTVRSITPCAAAGVCPAEVLDVGRYAAGLTRWYLAAAEGPSLPRKLKIALAGCERDCGAALVNDLALVACRGDGGEPGFRVYAGGGLGARSRVADLLEPFVPPERAPLLVEAVRRVFRQRGNRRDRRHARLRFLVEEIGIDAFRSLVRDELARTLAESRAARGAPVFALPGELAPRGSARRPVGWTPAPGFYEWCTEAAHGQRQPGRFWVEVPLHLGALDPDRADALADLAEEHGTGALHLGPGQHLALRWVEHDALPALHRRLRELELTEPPGGIRVDLAACAGASTCRPGICRSRDLAKAILDELAASDVDRGRLAGLRIRISGCPNACSRHPLADIALVGVARRERGELHPCYLLQTAGGVSPGHARLAEGKAIVHARRVPALVRELLAAFVRAPEHPDFAAFALGSGAGLTDTLARRASAADEGARGFGAGARGPAALRLDWGSSVPFSLAGRAPSECGAGVLDLVELDLSAANEALAAGDPLGATVAASRALLVTRGLEARTDGEALALFVQHLVEPGHLDRAFRPLLEAARESLGRTDGARAFPPPGMEPRRFVQAVEALYRRMDASLELPPVAATPPEPAPAAEADLRAVACPLNFMKAKLLVARIRPGESLAVLLSPEGKERVSRSMAEEGHEVLSATPVEGGHRVLIRRRA